MEQGVKRCGAHDAWMRGLGGLLGQVGIRWRDVYWTSSDAPWLAPSLCGVWRIAYVQGGGEGTFRGRKSSSCLGVT